MNANLLYIHVAVWHSKVAYFIYIQFHNRSFTVALLQWRKHSVCTKCSQYFQFGSCELVSSLQVFFLQGPKSIFCLPLPLLFFNKVNNFYIREKSIYLCPTLIQKKLRWLTKIHNVNLKLSKGNQPRESQRREGQRIECNYGTKCPQ